MGHYWGQLADDVFHPFNEYLKITVEFGCFGLLFVVLFLYMFGRKKWNFNNKYDILAFEVGIIIIVSSFFSYILFYPLSWFCIGWGISILLPRRSYKVAVRLPIKLAFGMIPAFFFFYICNVLWYYQQWEKVLIKTPLNDDTIVEYRKLYSILKQDGRFLYNYAAILNENGQYDQSVIILNKALMKMDTYDIQILMADNYEKMEEFDLEERYLKNAVQMCPNRFIPLYLLVKLYDKTNRKREALELAELILSKKIKVQSFTVKKIKADMYDYINL